LPLWCGRRDLELDLSPVSCAPAGFYKFLALKTRISDFFFGQQTYIHEQLELVLKSSKKYGSFSCNFMEARKLFTIKSTTISYTKSLKTDRAYPKVRIICIRLSFEELLNLGFDGFFKA
jgi:hypothetical protein